MFDAFSLIGIGGIIALHWVTFYGSIKYANVSVSLVCFSAIGFFQPFWIPLFPKENLNGWKCCLDVW